MSDMKYWAFEDGRARDPGMTRLEEKLADWSRGWEQSKTEWKAYTDRLRLKRAARGFKSPL